MKQVIEKQQIRNKMIWNWYQRTDKVKLLRETDTQLLIWRKWYETTDMNKANEKQLNFKKMMQSHRHEATDTIIDPKQLMRNYWYKVPDAKLLMQSIWCGTTDTEQLMRNYQSKVTNIKVLLQKNWHKTIHSKQLMLS